MGTLDSIDKDYSKLPPEDELLDIHGNEDITIPPLPHSDYTMALFPPYQVKTDIASFSPQDVFMCTFINFLLSPCFI